MRTRTAQLSLLILFLSNVVYVQAAAWSPKLQSSFSHLERDLVNLEETLSGRKVEPETGTTVTEEVAVKPDDKVPHHKRSLSFLTKGAGKLLAVGIMDQFGKMGLLVNSSVPAFRELDAHEKRRLSHAYVFETAWSVAMLRAAETTELPEDLDVQIKSRGETLWPQVPDGRQYWKAFRAFYTAYSNLHPEMNVEGSLTAFLGASPLDNHKFWTALHAAAVRMKDHLDEGLKANDKTGEIDDAGLKSAGAGMELCPGPHMAKSKAGSVSERNLGSCALRNARFRNKYWFFKLRGRGKDGHSPVKVSRTAGGMDILTTGLGDISTFGNVIDVNDLKDYFSEPIPHGKDFWDPNPGGLVFKLFAKIAAPFVAAVSGTTEMFILAIEQADVIQAEDGDLKARELLLVLWMAQLISAGHHSFTEILLASRILGYFTSIPMPDLHPYKAMVAVEMASADDAPFFAANPGIAEPDGSLQFLHEDGEGYTNSIFETMILFCLYVETQFGLVADNGVFQSIQMGANRLGVLPYLCMSACPDKNYAVCFRTPAAVAKCLEVFP